MTKSDDEPKPNADTVIEIAGGGVEVKLDGPSVTAQAAFSLWRSVREHIQEHGVIPKSEPIGSGTGFVAEKAETPERSPWLGEDGIRVTHAPHAGDVRSEAGQAAAASLGMTVDKPKDKPLGCFHPWPGCNCG